MIRFSIDCPNDCTHLTSLDLSADNLTQEVIGGFKRITSEFTRLAYTVEKESDAIADILRRMAQESRDADKFARYYVRKYKANNWLKMHEFPKRRKNDGK